MDYTIGVLGSQLAAYIARAIQFSEADGEAIPWIVSIKNWIAPP